MAYLSFFLAVTLIGPGSAYYHLDPNNASLVWDRLPMSMAYMSLLAITVGEQVSVSAAQRLLFPLLLMGLASVLYWYGGEILGQGDLRPYGLVQFLSILMIVLILLLYPAKFGGRAYTWAMIGAYAAAKLAEGLDHPIYARLHPIGGHSLKHLLGALAIYLFLLGLRRRRPLP